MRFRKPPRMATLCLWLCFTWALFISSPSYSAGFNDAWDDEIQDAVRAYWPDLPTWRLWKAQLWQESNLRSDVCSAVGACGMAQFMLPTWRGILSEMRYSGDTPRADARVSIAAGAYYQAKLRRAWRPEGRTGLARNDLGAASYNAGIGSILKAQSACHDARLWPDIAPCLGQITGPDHARETTGYVANIRKWWTMMEAER